MSELGVAARGQAESGRRNGLQVGVQVANNRAQKAKLKTREQPSEGTKEHERKKTGANKAESVYSHSEWRNALVGVVYNHCGVCQKFILEIWTVPRWNRTLHTSMRNFKLVSINNKFRFTFGMKSIHLTGKKVCAVRWKCWTNNVALKGNRSQLWNVKPYLRNKSKCVCIIEKSTTMKKSINGE